MSSLIRLKFKLVVGITFMSIRTKIGVAFSLLLLPTSINANEFSATIINDASSLVSGGIDETSAIRTLAAASAEIAINDNFTFYADAAFLRGDNGTLDTGAIQAYSNIDEDEFSKIYEAWIEGNYQDKGLRFKLGQIDANTEFAFIDHGGEFIHSSMGFSPTIAFLPTYPTPTLAGALFWQPIENGTASFAVFSDDSNEFNEFFYIGEWTQHLDSTIIKLGMWHQTGDIEVLTGENSIDGTEGLYVTAEGDLSMQLLSSQSAGWYSQLGYSDNKVVEIDFHFNVGIVFYDTFNREGDVLGGGVTHVTTSKYLHDELQSSETAFELFYRYQLNDYIAFKPDVQYIVDPATDKNADNALVLTLRTEISF